MTKILVLISTFLLFFSCAMPNQNISGEIEMTGIPRQELLQEYIDQSESCGISNEGFVTHYLTPNHGYQDVFFESWHFKRWVILDEVPTMVIWIRIDIISDDGIEWTFDRFNINKITNLERYLP